MLNREENFDIETATPSATLCKTCRACIECPAYHQCERACSVPSDEDDLLWVHKALADFEIQGIVNGEERDNLAESLDDGDKEREDWTESWDE